VPDAELVLLVHDNVEMSGELEAVLADAGYEVHAANSVEQAQRLASNRYAFAVIDLELGRPETLEGINLAQHVVAARSSPDTRFVIVSLRELDAGIEARLKSALGGSYGYVCWLAGNTVDELRRELEYLGKTRAKRKCFVIMPFDKKGESTRPRARLFEEAIKPAVEKSGRYECTLSSPPAGTVEGHVVSNLVTAEVVIADITGGNPNVFYELGIRDAKANVTVHISQDLSERDPFYIESNTVLRYQDDEPGRAALREALIQKMHSVAKEIDDNQGRSLVSRARSHLLEDVELKR
jgi:CheY-like chemotaxis protein